MRIQENMDKIPFLNQAFSLIIKSKREKSKLTQAELAKLIGGSVEAISLLERGVHAPTTTTLFLLAKALNTTPEALIVEIQHQMSYLENNESSKE